MVFMVETSSLATATFWAACFSSFFRALLLKHLSLGTHLLPFVSAVLSCFCVKLNFPSLVFEASLVRSCFHFTCLMMEASSPVLSMLVWISPFMAEDNKWILLLGFRMKIKNWKSASPHRRWNWSSSNGCFDLCKYFEASGQELLCLFIDTF